MSLEESELTERSSLLLFRGRIALPLDFSTNGHYNEKCTVQQPTLQIQLKAGETISRDERNKMLR